MGSQETSGHKSRTPSCAASAAACIRRPQVTQSDGVTSQWQPSQLSRRMARSTSSSTTSYDSSGGPAQQPQLKRWTEHHPSMNHRSIASSAVGGALLSSRDSPGSRVAHRSAAGWCTGHTVAHTAQQPAQQPGAAPAQHPASLSQVEHNLNSLYNINEMLPWTCQNSIGTGTARARKCVSYIRFHDFWNLFHIMKSNMKS